MANAEPTKVHTSSSAFKRLCLKLSYLLHCCKTIFRSYSYPVLFRFQCFTKFIWNFIMIFFWCLCHLFSIIICFLSEASNLSFLFLQYINVLYCWLILDISIFCNILLFLWCYGSKPAACHFKDSFIHCRLLYSSRSRGTTQIIPRLYTDCQVSLCLARGFQAIIRPIYHHDFDDAIDSNRSYNVIGDSRSTIW